MNKIILLLAISIIFSCKNKTENNKNKIEDSISIETTIKQQEKPVSEATVPAFSVWRHAQTNTDKIQDTFDQNAVYKVSRSDTDKPGYLSINNIEIYNGSEYQISAVVKKGDVGSAFGLRIQSVYPNRIDAIFDLERGEVVSSSVTGTELADGTEATIEKVESGWFKCSLRTVFKADQIRVIMGPTDRLKKSQSWESATGDKNNILIAPKALKILEY